MTVETPQEVVCFGALKIVDQRTVIGAVAPTVVPIHAQASLDDDKKVDAVT